MLAKQTYKVCRRLGAGVYDKCQTQKFVVSEAHHAKFAKRAKRNLSDFAKQLLEKQRVRFAYGLTERQLRKYVEEAKRVSVLGIDPIARMVEQLEMRLDNVVYRMGLVATRRAARQLVSHGHILVNGTRSTVPSMQISTGDTLEVRARTKNLPIMSSIKERVESATQPAWITFDQTKLAGKVTATPKADTTEMPGSIAAILEYYSR
jgi:small subunit ribosomal protein S4